MMFTNISSFVMKLNLYVLLDIFGLWLGILEVFCIFFIALCCAGVSYSPHTYHAFLVSGEITLPSIMYRSEYLG